MPAHSAAELAPKPYDGASAQKSSIGRMNLSPAGSSPEHTHGGIQLSVQFPQDPANLMREVSAWLASLELESWSQFTIEGRPDERCSLRCTLHPDAQRRLMPGFDTLDLHQVLAHPDKTPSHWTLAREICVALLGSPHVFGFASLAALQFNAS